MSFNAISFFRVNLHFKSDDHMFTFYGRLDPEQTSYSTVITWQIFSTQSNFFTCCSLENG